MEKEYVVGGRNSVLEILDSNNSIVKKIYIAEGINRGSVKKIMSIAEKKNIQVDFVEKWELEKLTDIDSHQGVAAVISAYQYKEIDDIFKTAEERGEPPFIIVLDQIEDNHNFGAIIRTAESVGVHGIIIPKRRSVSVTATTMKTSVGAVEYMNIVRVTNLSDTIEELKKRGTWVYGADVEGRDYYDTDLKGSIVLVVGSEGSGISRIVKEKCDALVKIPMKGKISSLNASVASSILMYEIVRQRSLA